MSSGRILNEWMNIFNCNWVDTQWQQFSSHLHTNNTPNTENGIYIIITKLNVHNNKQLTNLGSAGRAPSLRVIPWHLPYEWGKSTEKPQSGWQHVQHKQTQYNKRTMNSTIRRRKRVTQSITMTQNNKKHIIHNREKTITEGKQLWLVEKQKSPIFKWSTPRVCPFTGSEQLAPITRIMDSVE
jgi:hypothetical protein